MVDVYAFTWEREREEKRWIDKKRERVNKKEAKRNENREKDGLYSAINILHTNMWTI